MKTEAFKNEYAFLSNFYNAKVEYDGICYNNNEAAFQAQKTINRKERLMFANLNPSHAKKLGREVNLRKNWDFIKTDIMYRICFAKFSQNKDLQKKLLDTKDMELEETNWWHDNCWGNCVCDKCKNIVGENKLGKILMRIREELRKEIKDDK